MQLGREFTKILRRYAIAQETTEPHHPWQNPAERHAQDVKKYTTKIMARVGAPQSLWFLCMLYVVYLLNHTATESINWRTPIEKCMGVTPDISALLQYHFYERVYYKTFSTFSEDDEAVGHVVGIAEHVGDALTYWILTSNNQVLACSLVCPADNPLEPNKCADTQSQCFDSTDEGRFVDKPTDDGTNVDLQLMSDITGSPTKPVIDPVDLVGHTFLHDYNGFPSKAIVRDYDAEMEKVLVEYASGVEEWLSPSIVEESLFAHADDGEGYWTFQEILNHRLAGNG
jgi:hypothetical protein